MTHSPDYLKGRADGRAEALEEAAQYHDLQAHIYAGHLERAERRDPSFSGYVCDATYNFWSGQLSTHRSAATAIRALKETPR